MKFQFNFEKSQCHNLSNIVTQYTIIIRRRIYQVNPLYLDCTHHNILYGARQPWPVLGQEEATETFLGLVLVSSQSLYFPKFCFWHFPGLLIFFFLRKVFAVTALDMCVVWCSLVPSCARLYAPLLPILQYMIDPLWYNVSVNFLQYMCHLVNILQSFVCDWSA